MTLHPAYLWIGFNQALTHQASSFIKQHLCMGLRSVTTADDGLSACNMCRDCKGINAHQHHLLLWIKPETNYTLGLLDQVRHTISFALQDGEHFFIVFERAELFNAACANSLLKSLEEPPRGYHFILLAERTDGILATIRSRCIVENLGGAMEGHRHPLFQYFAASRYAQASEFMRDLERFKPSERDVPELLDQVNAYWLAQLKEVYAKNNIADLESIKMRIASLEEARKLNLMPGSAKIFLRNLFLSFL